MKRQFTKEEILDRMSRLYASDSLLVEYNKNPKKFIEKINILVDIYTDEEKANSEGFYLKDLPYGFADLIMTLVKVVEREALEADNRKKYSGIKPIVSDRLQVGAILVSSWGYEQTNIDFYCVVDATAKMVTLLPMLKDYKETGFLSGKSLPVQIDFTKKVIKCKKRDYIKVKYCACAKLWDGWPEYESHYA